MILNKIKEAFIPAFMDLTSTAKTLPPFPLKPLVRIKTPVPKSKFDLPEELKLFHIKSSILIILAAHVSSLDVFYFNLSSKKMFSCRNIQLPLPIEDFWEPNMSVAELDGQFIILLRISDSIFQVFTLMSLQLIWEIDYTKYSKRKVYCSLVFNQMLTWAEDSNQLRFWKISANEIQSTLELPSNPGSTFIVIMKRNVLVVSSQDKQNLFIIDANSQELKHVVKILTKEELITGISFMKDTIFMSKKPGIQNLLITKYFLDKQFKLQVAYSSSHIAVDPILKRFEDADIVSYYDRGILHLVEYREEKLAIVYELNKIDANCIYDCTALHLRKMVCLLDSTNVLFLYKLFSPNVLRLGSV